MPKNSTTNHRGADMDEREYPDRALAMTRAAQRAEAGIIAGLIAEFRQVIQTDRFAVIKGAQLAWNIGASVQRFTGHEKLLPADFQKLLTSSATPSADDPGALELPPVIADLRLGFLKECLAAHHATPAPPEAYEACRPVFDRLMVQLELLAVPAHGGQTAHPREPLREFMTELGRLATHCKRIQAEATPDDLKPFYIETILRDTETVVAVRDWLKSKLPSGLDN